MNNNNNLSFKMHSELCKNKDKILSLRKYSINIKKTTVKVRSTWYIVLKKNITKVYLKKNLNLKYITISLLFNMICITDIQDTIVALCTTIELVRVLRSPRDTLER